MAHALEEVSFPHILATIPQSSVISCKSIANMWRKLIECDRKNMETHLKYICHFFLGIIKKYHSKIKI